MNGQRRAWLKAATLLTGGSGLWGCREAPPLDGGWLGSAHERGHLLRDLAGSLPSGAPAVERQASVVVIGAGVAGLACARQLLRAGIDDVHVLELEDAPGGNSRGHQIAGLPCPLGAHYLPLPGPHATEVAELLSDWGLRSLDHGQPVYDERHLCHSPQERLWIEGQWHEGLLPPVETLPAAQRAATQAEYQRFARQIEGLGARQAFTLPTARSTWTDALSALEAQTFAAWLDQEGYVTPALRWYLDYCCHDDYGAGAAQVSAWAGVHYFASRHGFQPPGAPLSERERDTVLTWPQGNAWLTERLAEPLGAPHTGRLHTGQLSWRVVPQRHGVAVDCWNTRAAQHERWQARQVVLALPLFVAARLLTDSSAPAQALQALRPLMRQAPWLVANVHLGAPLLHQEGAAPAWDNLVYQPDLQISGQAPGRPLGWVDATHQRTRPEPGPTVLTAYWALGGQDLAQLQAQRQRLLQDPWSSWAERVLEQPAQVHPDLRGKVRRIDLMRYGHGMAIPTPGLRRHPALRALGATEGGRVHFAHADLSAYSVFEEAVYWGTRAARSVVKALR
ncbi:MAG: FAD-dependent oxidoreductase [Pseudomonadota bacterium]